jgi:sugar phosphate isomerase/epimerase
VGSKVAPGVDSFPKEEDCNMKIAVADSAKIEDVLPLVRAYDVGIEIQEFALPENLDGRAGGDQLAHELAAKTASVSLRALHGPFMELIPASRDRLVQDVARTRFESAYDVARIINAQHLILHTGYFPKTYPHDTWIANSAAFWTDFLADKAGSMRIYLENIYEDDFGIIVELFKRVNEALGRDVLSMCLDIGHVHANSSKSLAQWITGLGSTIQYTHLHNNDGLRDDHWGLWRGKINVAEILELLLKHAPGAVWTIEANSEDVERSLQWLQEKGYL